MYDHYINLHKIRIETTVSKFISVYLKSILIKYVLNIYVYTNVHMDLIHIIYI